MGETDRQRQSRQRDRQAGMKTLTERQLSAWTGDIIDTTARHRQTDSRKRQIAAQIERDWHREEKKRRGARRLKEREEGAASKARGRKLATESQQRKMHVPTK